MKLTSINTLQDVKEFVHILMEEEGLNFHPDTSFENYVHKESGEPYYTEQQAKIRNGLLNQGYELGQRIGVDTHEVMCEEGFLILKKKFAPLFS